jgi:tetratricopeptide (TPR) repeat protein
VKQVQAPEIFQKPIASLDMTGLPPRGSPGFADALIARYALDYASKGWNAVVTVDDEYVRVVAVPERGMDPKKYVLGLLKHRYLEDALPILEALYGMVDDADIAYNYGICLSETGKIEESVKPLEHCVQLDKEYTNAYVGLGVTYTRLGRNEDAEHALRQAIEQDPKNAYAKRNLAAVLARAGKRAESLPYFRQVVSLTPNDPAVRLGLAQCLDELGGEYRREADKVYREILRPTSLNRRSTRWRMRNCTIRWMVKSGWMPSTICRAPWMNSPEDRSRRSVRSSWRSRYSAKVACRSTSRTRATR